MQLRRLAVALAFAAAPPVLAQVAAAPATTPIPAAAPASPSGTPVLLHVLAKGSGIPLGKVEVVVAGQKQLTNKDGELTLNVPAGAGKVEIHRPGYEAATLAYDELRKGGLYEVYLYPAGPQDNEVIVRGQRRPEVTQKSVTMEEAAKVAPGGDAAQIPKLLPGVQSSSFRPDIVVWGSGPQDTLYYVDEWSLPYIFHRIGNISVVPKELLTDVDFSTGGFGAEYGNATGGVVALRTKNEVPERPLTKFDINIPVYSGVYHERPVNDGKDLFAASIRRSYLELFLPALFKKAGTGSLTVVPFFEDAHLYYYSPKDDGFVKVFGLFSDDGLKLAVNSEDATDQSGKGHFSLDDSVSLLGAEWKKTLNHDWSITNSPYISEIQSKTDVFDFYIHTKIDFVADRTEVERRLGGKDKLRFGIDAGYAQVKADVLAPQPPTGNDPFYDFQDAPKIHQTVHKPYDDVALYASLDKWLGPLLVTPGLRGFYDSAIDRTGYDPRLQLRYELTKEHALKAAIGQYSEAPQPVDTIPGFGNPHLKYIRAMEYVLGLDSKWGDLWTTDFEVFDKRISDDVRGDPVTVKSNAGQDHTYGFQAFIRRNLTERLFGWVSYTWSKNLVRDAQDRPWYNSQYDETNVLNVTGDYKFTAIWSLGGYALYHTGDTYTRVDGGVYNANLDQYGRRQDPGALPNNDRMPPYNEMDLYAERDALYDTWKLTWRFGLQFLAFGGRPVQGVQYNYDYTKKEYFRGIPPIPYLELKGQL